jgi:cardiolipin synthase (CMP-forming)
MMKGKIFTLSNWISLSRIVLMIPAAYMFGSSIQFHREITVLIILVAITTDALDGYFARKFNEISELGKIIDPLADKIGIGIVVVMLVIYNDISLWLMVIVLSRDVIIFFAGLYIKKKTGIILPSLMSGKVAVSFLAFTLVFAILKYPKLEVVYSILIVVTLLLMGYSFIVYTKRFFITLRDFSRQISKSK